VAVEPNWPGGIDPEGSEPGGIETVVTAMTSGTRLLEVIVDTAPFVPVDVNTVVCSLNEVLNEVLSSPV